MSTSIILCPGCHVKLKVPDGRSRLRCPKCSTDIEMDAESNGQPEDTYQLSSSEAAASPGGSSRRDDGKFPALHVDGPNIDLQDCIEPGTSTALMLGYLGLGFGAVFLTVVTWGVALIALLFSPLINYFNHKKTLALIHGSGVKVGPGQFPEIDRCVRKMWNRLSLREPPDVYVVEASVMNAFAVKLGRKDLILLTDDMVHGCLLSHDPRTLAFVIGHELAHAALKHNTPTRVSMHGFIKRLSRLDEYTADRVAARLVQEPGVAVRGIVLLTVGPHLLKYINYGEIEAQVNEVVSNKRSKKAERTLTHPLLLHRLNHVMNER